MERRVAKVYYGRRLAGRLWQTGRGFVFQYDPAYLPTGTPISRRLPPRAAPYRTKQLLPFFEGLLPEGWYLEIVSKTLKVDPADRFGLLLATCRDCIGPVSIRPVR